MTLGELIALQKSFDDRHGWNKSGAEIPERVDLIGKDLIGLVGEVGEFANILKKIQLLENTPIELTEEYERRLPDLAEEIVDALIYLIRVAGHIEVDIEKAYLDKLQLNDEKYRKFEKNNK